MYVNPNPNYMLIRFLFWAISFGTSVRANETAVRNILFALLDTLCVLSTRIQILSLFFCFVGALRLAPLPCTRCIGVWAWTQRRKNWENGENGASGVSVESGEFDGWPILTGFRANGMRRLPLRHPFCFTTFFSPLSPAEEYIIQKPFRCCTMPRI